ncbi:uncharacterized protein K452DRAFT_153312 [Aplosporella prunicola CBS 121167]|uniref:Uncharacterized protein n=1 Tax=Aplosporella prunicola CBS 121167 TaxID=1176127 RepID=A0A6A6BJC2_9PEZI|nr:uncharacterized protein K452DRAFT_153312 [Aplosporella prunicola CBS 121167]KAF2144116.1 hypothetical protein K452DRAFT_153312 [Aplosporella prunicola CBS 121167]
MAPPVSSYEEAKMYGLHWSRFRAGGNAEGEPGSFDVNKMTNDALARQESISRRVMVLRNKRSASAEEDRKSTKSEGSDPDSKLRRAKEEAQHWESERQQAKQREQERTAAELLEKERLKQEHRDQERIKQERLEHERLEHERLEQERRELDRLEQQRIEQLRLEQERREKARLEEERLEQERLQQERLDQERRDQALREEKEHLEQERLEQERLEQERREKERREQERLEQERLEQERHEEQERLEQQRLELKRREEEMERELARLKTQIQGQLLEKHKKLISEVDTTEREALQKAQDQQDIVEKEITDISARRNELGSQQHSKELEIGNKKLEIEELTKVLEEAKEALERLQHEAASIENSKARIEEERTEAQELLLAIHAEQNIISEQATGERSRLEKAFAKESSSVDDLAKEAASRTVNPSQDTKSVEPSNGTKPGVNKPADDKFDVDKFDVDKFDADKSDINKTPDAVPAEIEDLTHQDFFKAWPKSESRPFGAAPKRLVKLTNLPSTSTLISIQALVWGGRIEKLAYLPGSTSAWALFMRGEDSERYLKDTANGIDAPGEQKRVIWVEPCEPVSVGEFIHAAYQAGVTRCVRAVGVDSDWGMLALNKFATAKNRKIERVVDGVNPSGLRVVEFRFSNIVDSSRFKVELQNDMEWEHCNIYYSADPCETNTGIHTGIH